MQAACAVILKATFVLQIILNKRCVLDFASWSVYVCLGFIIFRHQFNLFVAEILIVAPDLPKIFVDGVINL